MVLLYFMFSGQPTRWQHVFIGVTPGKALGYKPRFTPYAGFKRERTLADYSVFEYFYCDASNYKSWGCLLLAGVFQPSDIERLQLHFEAGEFFVSEQLGIPALYTELWARSGGPTRADHVWHTFYALRQAAADDLTLPVYGDVEVLVARICAVSQWNETLSSYWKAAC